MVRCRAPHLTLVSALAVACGSDETKVQDGGGERDAGPPDAASHAAPATSGVFVSPDGRVSLDIRPGALADPFPIVIAPSSEASPPAAVGPTYAVAPHGVLLARATSVTFRYEDAWLPAGVAGLSIAMFGAGQAFPLKTTIDPVARVATAEVTHFGRIGLSYATPLADRAAVAAKISQAFVPSLWSPQPVVTGPMAPLPAGTRITQAFGPYATTFPPADSETTATAREGDPLVATLAAPAWFFWADLTPGALHAHPSLYIIGDPVTGTFQVQPAVSWPVIDGGAMGALLEERVNSPLTIFKPADLQATVPPVSPMPSAPPAPQPLSIETSRRALHQSQCPCNGSIAIVMRTSPEGAFVASQNVVADHLKAPATASGWKPENVHTPVVSTQEEFTEALSPLFDKSDPRCWCEVLIYVVSHGSDGALVFRDGSNTKSGEMPYSVLVESLKGLCSRKTTLFIESCEAGSIYDTIDDTRARAAKAKPGGALAKATAAFACLDMTVITSSQKGRSAFGSGVTPWSNPMGYTRAWVAQLQSASASGTPDDFSGSASRAAGSLNPWIAYSSPAQKTYMPLPGGECCDCCGSDKTGCVRESESAAIQEKIGATVDVQLARTLDRNPTKNSNPNVASKPGAKDHTEFCAVGEALAFLSSEDVTAAFNNSFYPCGSGANGLTLCQGNAPFPAGEALIVLNGLEGPVPVMDPRNHYQYGFVFDSDNDRANNYQPIPAFANDFFKDTDRWYQARYSPADGWSLKVTDPKLDPQGLVASDARLIIKDNVMGVVIPVSEFAVRNPSYRVTAFRHTGDFGQNSPFDWAGDVEPPVDKGLFSFEAP